MNGRPREMSGAGRDRLPGSEIAQQPGLPAGHREDGTVRVFRDEARQAAFARQDLGDPRHVHQAGAVGAEEGRPELRHQLVESVLDQETRVGRASEVDRLLGFEPDSSAGSRRTILLARRAGMRSGAAAAKAPPAAGAAVGCSAFHLYAGA